MIHVAREYERTMTRRTIKPDTEKKFWQANVPNFALVPLPQATSETAQRKQTFRMLPGVWILKTPIDSASGIYNVMFDKVRPVLVVGKERHQWMIMLLSYTGRGRDGFVPIDIGWNDVSFIATNRIEYIPSTSFRNVAFIGLVDDDTFDVIMSQHYASVDTLFYGHVSNTRTELFEIYCKEFEFTYGPISKLGKLPDLIQKVKSVRF